MMITNEDLQKGKLTKVIYQLKMRDFSREITGQKGPGALFRGE